MTPTIGADGQTGKTTYPAGEYDYTKQYQCTSTTAPYVFERVDDKVEYYIYNSENPWKAEELGMEGKTLTSSVEEDWFEAYWIKMDSFSAVHAEILMAENATLDQAVFNNGYMFSKGGGFIDALPAFYKDPNVDWYYTVSGGTAYKHFGQEYYWEDGETNYSNIKFKYNADSNNNVVYPSVGEMYLDKYAFHPNIVLDFDSGDAVFKQGKIMFHGDVSDSAKINSDAIVGQDFQNGFSRRNGETTILSSNSGIYINNNGEIYIRRNGQDKTIDNYIKDVIRESAKVADPEASSSVTRLTLDGTSITLEKDTVSRDTDGNFIEITNGEETITSAALLNRNRLRVFYTSELDVQGRPYFSGYSQINAPLQSVLNTISLSAVINSGSLDENNLYNHYFLIVVDYDAIQRSSQSFGSIIEDKGTANVDELKHLQTASVKVIRPSSTDTINAGIANIAESSTSDFSVDGLIFEDLPLNTSTVTVVKVQATDKELFSRITIPVRIIEDEHRYTSDLDAELSKNSPTLIPNGLEELTVNITMGDFFAREYDSSN